MIYVGIDVAKDKHDCYISDSNRTPLGALADYVADHWRKIRKKGRHEILDEFYSHV